MRRPRLQFRLSTLLWIMLAVILACCYGKPFARPLTPMYWVPEGSTLHDAADDELDPEQAAEIGAHNCFAPFDVPPPDGH
jgi:hypothetical protein